MTPEVFKAMSRRGDGKLWLPDFLNALFLDFDAIDERSVAPRRPENAEGVATPRYSRNDRLGP